MRCVPWGRWIEIGGMGSIHRESVWGERRGEERGEWGEWDLKKRSVDYKGMKARTQGPDKFLL